jgi:release factor glutamine methyltransferase
MRRLLKTLTPIIKPLMLRYLSKKRKFTYEGISVVIHPGVFHPGVFFSTKFLLKFLSTLEIRSAQLLELGAGSGLIAIYCSKIKNATVTASDISTVAIKSLEESAKINHAKIRIIQSDLFDHLDPSDFDVIVINPPFYPKNPTTETEKTWYCGEDFQYFRKLFFQMRATKPSSVAYMILSEDCQIAQINTIATNNSFSFNLKAQKTIWGERNFIYEITKI